MSFPGFLGSMLIVGATVFVLWCFGFIGNGYHYGPPRFAGMTFNQNAEDDDGFQTAGYRRHGGGGYRGGYGGQQPFNAFRGRPPSWQPNYRVEHRRVVPAPCVNPGEWQDPQGICHGTRTYWVPNAAGDIQQF